MLAVEFIIEKPQGGIRFVKRKPHDNTDPLDVYVATVDHNSCYWFPCINSSNEPCTWKIEVLVDKDFTVVASGNLIEVESQTQLVSNPDPIETMPPPKSTTQLKKYHYFMSVPTPAVNIGLVIGRFDTISDENLPEVSYYYDSLLKPLVKETCSCINEIFEFYEETFTFHFPFGSHKLVFLPDLAEDYISFSSMTIVK